MSPQFFTSYFANLKNLPEYLEPIAICGGIPDWYHGLWYKKLAPSWSIWKEWHDSNAEDKNEHYVSRFIPEILGKLDVKQVAEDLKKLQMAKHLACYAMKSQRNSVIGILSQSGLRTADLRRKSLDL